MGSSVDQYGWTATGDGSSNCPNWAGLRSTNPHRCLGDTPTRMTSRARRGLAAHSHDSPERWCDRWAAARMKHSELFGHLPHTVREGLRPAMRFLELCNEP